MKARYGGTRRTGEACSDAPNQEATTLIPARGYAARSPTSGLAPIEFNRRDLKDHDILIDVDYCGVCHSDVHQVRDEWEGSLYPMVPGHEIVGRVVRVGPRVTRFKPGDLAGVGCMVDSCRACAPCKAHLEQYCEEGFVGTYNATERGTGEPTYGGYANNIVVDEAFTLRIPEAANLAGVAPLLCAGITTYSPMKRWGVSRGKRVGVVGLGGLGHMGVKFARALGAHVAVFTTSPGKGQDARRLGADEVVISRDAAAMEAQAGRFDLILDTVSAPHDLNPYLAALKLDGVLVLVGLPEEAPEVEPFHLVSKRRVLTGSLIGGVAETQEMLDFCAANGITADVEVIPIEEINEAYDRMVRSDVKYRFVIDLKSLR